jgi:hypothetical protein
MHLRAIGLALVLMSALLAAGRATAQEPLPAIEAKTRGLEKLDGFLPLYWDAGEGKLWLEVPRLNEEMIYAVSLAAGLGSNDVGLDRGQLGGERIVRFERVGRKVLMVQPNYRYRAETENPDERRAVQEAFARSVLWGFTVGAETGERVLLDATEFALRDAHNAIQRLRRTGQGRFELDESRSAIYLERTRAFPRNTEIEVTLTFTADSVGPWVREVAPTPEALTLRERHSFVALPEPGYEMRESDPRAGFFGIEYRDYAVPLGEPMVKRFISRHRLAKRDPGAPVSEAVEPIVYYLDRGAPEPIRTALLQGARWWNDAFEAAGYRNAFRVELLPEGADPLDVRYNVIQWVHRSTRGWSYGSSVTDPRTGEIIKGHVSLGSLRVRQDYLIAEGLLSPYETGTETPPELAAMALARIRQLAAHEVGHTLGIAHNYIASTYGRGSVMDYPHPLARLSADGVVDLSAAYREGIGEWDKLAVTWGYQDFPEGTAETAELERLLADARAEGITFLSDQDARPAGSVHPEAHLWDNAADAAAELTRMMTVRRAALERFGEASIQRGVPLAMMEEALVPLYLHHRYQVEAAVKLLAGQHYTYALRGDGQEPPRPVSPERQEQALDALLSALRPEELAIPRPLLSLIPPRPFTYGSHRELFDRYTGLSFDAISPSVAVSELVASLVLQEERAARLVQQHALDPAMPGLSQVLDRLVEATFGRRYSDPYHAEIDRATERVIAEEMMRLAYRAPMPQVRAEATLALTELRNRMRRLGRRGPDPQKAHAMSLTSDLDRFLDRPYEPARRAPALTTPPGSPIGDQNQRLR